MITRRRAISFILFLVFLIPSAQFAWRNRDMPEFSYLHDDGILFISAKSLAEGNGFRVAQLPENPAQTKFPPLYPAVLSMIWRLNPNFPDNLKLATLFGWLLTAAGIGIAWTLYRSYGFSEKRIWILTGLLAISPYWTLFGSMMFSEMLFTCLVMASFILARREDNIVSVLGAGLLAACAYLTRTAGVALLISVPGLLLWKRKWKSAAAFTISPLIAAAGWAVWQRMHLVPSNDMTLVYYTDYMQFQKVNVGFDNAMVVFWKNLDQILYGMGALVMPKVVDMLPVKILTQVLGVAMISGVIRIVRKRVALDYALFSLVSVGILMVWHYPATERFVLPMFPLLLAGLVTEGEHFLGMLRTVLLPERAHPLQPSQPTRRKKNDAGNRVVGAMFGVGVAALFVAAIGLQLFMTFSFLHASAADQRAHLQDRKLAYRWIATNVPQEAAVLSYDDPLLYLYSGHRGNYMPLLPRWWYADDHTNMQKAYDNVAEYCRRRGLAYFYFTSEDLSREAGEDDREVIKKSIAANPALEPVFSAGIGTLYRVRSNSAYSTGQTTISLSKP